MPPTKVWPGQPHPLGATWDGKGVNFALFSAHAEKVELCLFDRSGQHEEARIVLPEYTDEVWHGYLPDGAARPALRLSRSRPLRPRRTATASTPTSCCSTRMRGRFPAHSRWSDALFGYRVGSPREDLAFDRRDSARFMPKCRVVETAFTWGDDRRPAHLVGRDDHSRDACARLHDAASRRSPSTSAARLPALACAGGDRLSASSSASPRSSCCRSRPSINERHSGRARLDELLGLQHDRLLRSRPALSRRRDRSSSSRRAVKRLHEAGIEVILDVVYNHTGEGNHLGPTLSFRGIDNLSYYRLRRRPPAL